MVATDRDGHPVPGRIEGVLLRPLEGIELPLAFGPRGGGRWAAEVQPTERGSEPKPAAAAAAPAAAGA